MRVIYHSRGRIFVRVGRIN